jgi:hypothetical protein
MHAGTSKSKRNRLLSVLVFLGCIVGWFFSGDLIRELIDREMVRNVRYDPGKTDLLPSARPNSRDRLALPKGKWVKAGPGVICYGRALGHHTLFGFRRGYSYVQINGKADGRAGGPCGSTQNILLAVDPLDSESFVTEDVVLQALKKDNFHLIP